MEGLIRKEKGLMDVDNRVMTVGVGGGDIRGISGNGKNIIKNKFKNKINHLFV